MEATSFGGPKDSRLASVIQYLLNPAYIIS